MQERPVKITQAHFSHWLYHIEEYSLLGDYSDLEDAAALVAKNEADKLKGVKKGNHRRISSTRSPRGI